MGFASRTLKHMRREPEQFSDGAIQPILFTVMFGFIFGGAISGDVASYLPTMVPGILAMTYREIDVLTPSRQRAGITAALYLAFYAGAGMPAIIVGTIAIGTSLIDAIMIFTLVLLLAIIVFIPVPSLALTTVRRSRAEAAAALDKQMTTGRAQSDSPDRFASARDH